MRLYISAADGIRIPLRLNKFQMLRSIENLRERFERYGVYWCLDGSLGIGRARSFQNQCLRASQLEAVMKMVVLPSRSRCPRPVFEMT